MRVGPSRNSKLIPPSRLPHSWTRALQRSAHVAPRPPHTRTPGRHTRHRGNALVEGREVRNGTGGRGTDTVPAHTRTVAAYPGGRGPAAARGANPAVDGRRLNEWHLLGERGANATVASGGACSCEPWGRVGRECGQSCVGDVRILSRDRLSDRRPRRRPLRCIVPDDVCCQPDAYDSPLRIRCNVARIHASIVPCHTILYTSGPRNADVSFAHQTASKLPGCFERINRRCSTTRAH